MLRWLTLRRIIRIWGAILLLGAIYIAYTSVARDRWHWYSGTIAALALPTGLGMLLHRRWAQVPGFLLAAFWAGVSVYALYHGGRPSTWLFNLFIAAVLAAALHRWDDPSLVTVEYARGGDETPGRDWPPPRA